MGIEFQRLSSPRQEPIHRAPVPFLAISISVFSAAPSHHLSQRRMAALRVRLLRRCLGRIGGYFRWNTRAPILF
jgi:hypothetical protein